MKKILHFFFGHKWEYSRKTYRGAKIVNLKGKVIFKDRVNMNYRICTRCGKQQKTYYLGGNMGPNWRDVH